MQVKSVVRMVVLCVAVVFAMASGSSGGGGGGGGGAKGPMPAGATWVGQWSSTFGPLQIIDMRGSENGFEYGGMYQYQLQGMTVNGVFAGKTDGNVFVLVWSEERGSQQAKGMARWFMNPDGVSFTGTWGNGDSVDNAGRWEGRKN